VTSSTALEGTGGSAPAPSSRLAFGPFLLDPADARLWRDGREVPLRPKAFELLRVLAARAGQLVTKDELLDAVWGTRFVTEGVIKTTVGELRVALDDGAKAPRWIETVARRGYRFCGVLQPLPAAGAAALLAPAASAASLAPVPRLIGRDAAWHALQAAWQRAAAGQRQAVLIGGEAGVGKTTLAEALAASLPPDAVAHGACVEGYGQSEPYGPWLQALAALAAQDPALPALLRQVAPHWLAQLPWLQAADDAGRDAAPERMPREMAALLERLTAQRPLLVWLEDLHWADHASVQLLDLLLRQRSPARLLLLGTLRTLDAAIAAHPMADARREWRLHGRVQDLTLDGLDGAGVAALVAARHPGARWPASALQALQQHTEGLPLFVLAVLDALAENGALAETTPGRWQLGASLPQPLPLPDSVGGLFEKQLAALAPSQRELLEAAAVVGREFDAGVLAEALGADAAEVHARCDGLVRGGRWLRGAGVSATAGAAASARYRFGHALMQGVCYARCGAARRIELHRRVAATLDARAGRDPHDGEELAAQRAWHHEQALDADAALPALARAMALARRRMAVREVLALAEHGLALVPRADPASRARWTRDFAHSRASAIGLLEGYASPAVGEAARLALAHSDPAVLDQPRLNLQRILWLHEVQRGRLDDALALAEATLALAEAEGDPARQVQALSMLHFSAFKCGAFDRARQAVARSDALAAQVQPADELYARFFAQQAHERRLIEAMIDTLEGRPDVADPVALRHMPEADHSPMSRVLNGLLVALWGAWRGDAAAVAEDAQALLALIEREELGSDTAPLRLLLHWVQGVRDDPAAALPLLRGALQEIAAGGRVADRAAFLDLAADLALRAGDVEAAATELDAAFAHVRATGERYILPRLWRRRAQIAEARGDGAAAERARGLERRAQAAPADALDDDAPRPPPAR
jgi:DNA-binding winged helix-turn-helix (wHTH) protein